MITVFEGVHARGITVLHNLGRVLDKMSAEEYCYYELPPCPVFQLLLNGVFTALCVIFGLFGSLASLIFIHRHYRGAKAAHKNTLGILIIWDMILLIGTFGYYGLWNIFRCSEWYFDRSFAYLALLFHPVISTAYTATSCLIVLVSLEKWVGVTVLISRRKQKQV